MNPTWKTISERVIFKHPRVTLVEDTVLLPDGDKTTYLKIKSNMDVATVIAVRSDGHILLQREYSYPPNEMLFRFPGGSIAQGENMEVAANRELMEEAGLRGRLQLVGSYLSDDRRSDAKTHVFVASDLQSASLPKSKDEFTESSIESGWHTEKEIEALVANGEFKQAYVLATWAVYKAWRSK